MIERNRLCERSKESKKFGVQKILLHSIFSVKKVLKEKKKATHWCGGPTLSSAATAAAAASASAAVAVANGPICIICMTPNHWPFTWQTCNSRTHLGSHARLLNYAFHVFIIIFWVLFQSKKYILHHLCMEEKNDSCEFYS